jgi:hypothetical protein
LHDDEEDKDDDDDSDGSHARERVDHETSNDGTNEVKVKAILHARRNTSGETFSVTTRDLNMRRWFFVVSKVAVTGASTGDGNKDATA